MNHSRKSLGALSCVAIGIALSCCPLSTAVPHDRPAPLRTLIDVTWYEVGPTLTLRLEDDRFDAFRVLTIEDFLASPRVSFSAQAAAGGISAVAGVSGALLGTGEAAGIWAVAAARLAFDAASRADRPDESIRIEHDQENEYLDFSAQAMRPNLPHRSLDYQMGIYENAEFDALWSDPARNFTPSKMNRMFSVYPSPGAAGLALIAGGCVLSRRRRT